MGVGLLWGRRVFIAVPATLHLPFLVLPFPAMDPLAPDSVILLLLSANE